MTAPTSLAETFASVMADDGWCCDPYGHEDGPPAPGECSDCDRLRNDTAAEMAEAARAWLVTRLNEHGPEVIDSHQFRMLRHGWGCSCGGDYLAAHAAHVVAALTEVLTDD